MKVAVVILNWNGLGFLKRFLGTVVERSSGSATVYLADNGSDDGSVKWVRENHPEVRVVENGSNYGFAEGYNRALQDIDSEYFVLLNSDVEVGEHWIDPVINYMDQNGDVAACQPKILSFQNKGSFEHAGAAGGFIDKYGYPFCRGRIFNIIEEDKRQYDSVTDIFWASGACLFIRSKIWNKFGGFDPDFFAHMEEIDLCWRINSQQLKIKFIPGSTVYHVGGGTLSYSSPTKLFYNFRNSLFLLHKNLPEKKFKTFIFLRLILDGIAAMKFLLAFNFSAFLQVPKSHIDYYRHLASLNSKRQAILKLKTSYPEKLILNKSLVFNFYLKKKKKFNDIWEEGV